MSGRNHVTSGGRDGVIWQMPEKFSRAWTSSVLSFPPIEHLSHPICSSIHGSAALPSTRTPAPNMSVIIPQQSGRSTTVERPAAAYSTSAQMTAWRILGWLGLAFFIMALIDLALGWYPVRFGSPEWEFGTISATVSGLAIPTLSLYLMLGAAFAREQKRMAKTLGIVLILLALALPALGILYLTNVPMALKSTATNDVVHLGMKKAILKAIMLFAGYELLYVIGAINVFRRRPAA